MKLMMMMNTIRLLEFTSHTGYKNVSQVSVKYLLDPHESH